MWRVLRAELLKLKRSKAMWGTVAIVVSFAAMTLTIFDMYLEPGGNAWEMSLGMNAQLIAGWYGVLTFSLAAASLFGSEFADGTAAAMFTTPVRREYFVAGKLAVLAVWVVALALISVAGEYVAGLLLGGQGFPGAAIWQALKDTLLVTFMLYLTLPLVGFISILGRGYLAPMLFASVTSAMSFAGMFIGWQRWLPWAMPITVRGGIVPVEMLKDSSMLPASWAILFATFAIGLAALFWSMGRAGERT